mgnify:CR=1 FL=1
MALTNAEFALRLVNIVAVLLPLAGILLQALVRADQRFTHADVAEYTGSIGALVLLLTVSAAAALLFLLGRDLPPLLTIGYVALLAAFTILASLVLNISEGFGTETTQQQSDPAGDVGVPPGGHASGERE